MGGQRPSGGSGNSGNSGGGSGGVGGADGKITAATNALQAGVSKIADATGNAAAGARENIEVWQKNSAAGANFSNDVVGMTVAAKGSRVDLGDFSDTIRENNKQFIGLGGNVGRGSQNFASLTQEMYDNYTGTTDALRAQGITNKELNDTLALQIGFQRGSFKDTKEGHQESIEAAARLADEMNKTSQLTGQTRKEQEDAMKKAQADMQVEAKMRLIGAKEGPAAEAKARAAFAEQYQQAQARGEGQYFKEVFATGHAVSQEAATQAALNGKQARATAEQAKATARGDAAAASAFNQKAREEQLKNAHDIAFLQRSTYGAASKATYEDNKARMAASQGMYDAESKIRQEAQFKNATHEEVLREIDKRAKMEKGGKTEKGDDLAGKASTDAALKLQQRTNDAASAIYTGMVKPINEGAAPALKNFTNSFLGGTVKTPTGEVMTRPQAQRKEVESGMQSGNATTVAQRVKGEAGGSTGIPEGRILGAVGEIGKNVANVVTGATNGLTNLINSKFGGPKAEGGPVDSAKTYLVGENGPELFKSKDMGSIIPTDQLKNMMGGLDGMKGMDPSKMFSSFGMGNPEDMVKNMTGGMMKNMPAGFDNMKKGMEGGLNQDAFAKMFPGNMKKSMEGGLNQDAFAKMFPGINTKVSGTGKASSSDRELEANFQKILKEQGPQAAEQARKDYQQQPGKIKPGESPEEAKKRIGEESLAVRRLEPSVGAISKSVTPPAIPKVEAPKPAPAAPAPAPAASQSTATKTTPGGAHEVSLKDVHKELQTLNKSIMQMVSHAEGTKEATLKQVKATKAMTNDRFQRG